MPDSVDTALTAPTACLDCGHVNEGEYCSQCGQRRGNLHHSLQEFAAAGLGSPGNSKTLSTLALLLRRPGYLTAAYWAGQRTRYVHPVRLYLSVSAIVFLVFAWWPNALLGMNEGELLQVSDTNAHAVKLDDTNFQAKMAEAHAELEKNQPSSWIERVITTAALRVTSEAQGESREAFFRGYALRLGRTIPKVLFVLLPVFALLLKLILRRPPRYYVEHLAFAFHTHSFFLLAFATGQMLSRLMQFDLSTLSNLLMVGYLFLALRTAYGLSLPQTVLRCGLLFVSYGIALTLGVIGATVSSIVQT